MAQKYCTYLTQGPMWWREGGNLTGVWCGRATASPNFFFLSTTFWWAGCSTIGSSLAVGYNRDYLFVPAIRSLALILWLRLFSNSSHCFSLAGRTHLQTWPSYSYSPRPLPSASILILLPFFLPSRQLHILPPRQLGSFLATAPFLSTLGLSGPLV